MKIGIIGGGICGLYLAWRLENYDVTVFEKRKTADGKACSSLISDRIFYFLPASKNIVRHEIHGVEIHFPKKDIYLNFKRKFFVFERNELERLLVFLSSKNKKAKIYFGQEIRNIPQGFDRIIFSDGALSLAQKIISFKGEKKYYLGIQGFEKKKDFSNVTHVFPTENGFIWKIPRGNDREWGIVERTEKAEKIFSDFLRKYNISLENKKASIIGQGLVLLNNPRMTLTGEAMGLTKPWSFGGIIWGLQACEILLNHFPDFLTYEKEAKKFFSRQFFLGKYLKKIVYFLGFNFPIFYFIREYVIDGDFFSLSSIFENFNYFLKGQKFPFLNFDFKKFKD